MFSNRSAPQAKIFHRKVWSFWLENDDFFILQKKNRFQINENYSSSIKNFTKSVIFLGDFQTPMVKKQKLHLETPPEISDRKKQIVKKKKRPDHFFFPSDYSPGLKCKQYFGPHCTLSMQTTSLITAALTHSWSKRSKRADFQQNKTWKS